MNITIVGAGNMGLTMTAYMTLYKKGKITLFTDGDFYEYIVGNRSVISGRSCSK